MKHVFFDCDNCFHPSTPDLTVRGAIIRAKEEGFRFVKGKHFCEKCFPHLSGENESHQPIIAEGVERGKTTD